MVKGYEFAKDQYVMFSAEGSRRWRHDDPRHRHRQFVPLESVDPVYFDGTYYSRPTKRREAVYAARDGAAQGRAVLRSDAGYRGQGAHRRDPADGRGSRHASAALQEQVRELKDLGIEPAQVSDPELKLAQQLIEHLAAKRFDPNEYQDEFKGRVEAAIQKKIQGKQISLSEAPVPAAGGT